MSTTAPPQIDVKQLEETRRHINRLIEEIARLSEADIGASEYFGEVLKRVLTAMAAPAGAVWVRSPGGGLHVGFQVNLREIGLDRNEESRKSHNELLQQAVMNPQPLHLLPQSGAGESRDGQVAPGNPTNYLLLLVPVLVNSEVYALLEVWQDPRRPQNAIPGFLQFMGTIGEQMARYGRNQLMGQMLGRQQTWVQLETFARQVHGSLNPTEVAYLVANEGRRLVDCDRVSVGIRMSSKTRIEAVSGADVVEKRSNLVKLMRQLFDAVLAWGEKLVYAGTKDDSLPPAVLRALDDYLHESNSKLLVLMPLKDEREKESKKPVRSGLLMECFETSEEAGPLVERLEKVGHHAVSALYNSIQYKRIPMRFLWIPLAKLQEGIGGRGRMILFLLGLGLTSLITALCLIQYPLKMEARGNLVPVSRRWVYSPEPGRIEQVYAEANQTDVPGTKLFQVYNSELAQKMKLLEPKLLAARKAQLRAADNLLKPQATAQDRLAAGEAERNFQQVLADWKTLTLNLDRPEAAPPGIFYVPLPAFDPEQDKLRLRYRLKYGLDQTARGRWTVLNSGFRDNLLGKSIDSTVPLLHIGDKESGWEVELKIPQQHHYQVLSAYDRLDTNVLDVDLKVRTEPTRTFKGKLYRHRINAEATPQRDDNNEPAPVVISYVSLDDDGIPMDERVPLELRTSGTEVIAKIRCGDAAMGYALFYGVWEFICEKILFAF